MSHPAAPRLSDADFHKLVVNVSERLHGLSIDQADHVLRTVFRLIAATTIVDTQASEFRRRVEMERPSDAAPRN